MATASELAQYTRTFTSFSGADIQCVFGGILNMGSI